MTPVSKPWLVLGARHDRLIRSAHLAEMTALAPHAHVVTLDAPHLVLHACGAAEGRRDPITTWLMLGREHVGNQQRSVGFFYRGRGLHGMSGGGVFDEAGRQVGMVVRGSQLESGPNFVRAVRMSYVVSSVRAAVQRLAPEETARVQPYLESDP